MYVHTYMCMHILIDGLREMDNTDRNISSSAGDTAQNVRTEALASNTESEILSTDQGILCV